VLGTSTCELRVLAASRDLRSAVAGTVNISADAFLKDGVARRSERAAKGERTRLASVAGNCRSFRSATRCSDGA
jgi:hypothetical protein